MSFEVPMRLLAAALALFATPALAQGVPGIEPVYGVSANRAGVTVRMASNGCTGKTDLTVALSKGQPRPILLIARKHPDACKTPGRADITYAWQELGLAPGQAFSFANPLVAEPALAAPASAPRSNAGCRRLEVDAVAEPGKGAVRVLGPQGPLDIDTPPLVAWGEVTGAQAGNEAGRTVVRVTLAPEAAQRLEAWTESHLGSRLVMLLDGQVLRIGDVRAPIGADGLLITGMDRNQATLTAAGLSACNQG
jgi:hypothetical protein